MFVHGVDLVDIRRLAAVAERHGDRFLERVFTEVERTYAVSRPQRRMEHLAARFACKEAVFKALGTGWRHGIAWTDVGIVNEPSGQPRLTLTGRSAELAAEQGLESWAVSLSHTDTHAIASVFALCRRGDCGADDGRSTVV